MLVPSLCALWFGLTGAINQEGGRQWAEVSVRAAGMNVALDLSPVRPASVPDAANVLGHPWLKAAILPGSPERDADSEWRKAEEKVLAPAGQLLWKGQPDSFAAAFALLQKEAPDHFPAGSPAPGPRSGMVLLNFVDRRKIPWEDLLTTLSRQYSQLPALGSFPDPGNFLPAPLQDTENLLFLGTRAGWRVAALLAAGEPGQALSLIKLQSRFGEAWLQHPTLLRLLTGTAHFISITNQARLGFNFRTWREEDLTWLESWTRSVDFTAALHAALVSELAFSLAMAEHLYQDPALLDRITGGLHQALFAARKAVEAKLPGVKIAGLPDGTEPVGFHTDDLIRALPKGALQIYQSRQVRLYLDHVLPTLERGGIRGLHALNLPDFPPRGLAAGFLAHEARLVLLRTACALQRYHQKHTQWPVRLADLVPDYLSTVPVDPCSEKPLVYQIAIPGGGCRIYSVGRNLTDETLGRFTGVIWEDDLYWILPDRP